MEERPRHIRIFASSPADVRDEVRETKKVVEELAPTFSKRGVTLELLTWETHTYSSPGPPQVSINHQIGSVQTSSSASCGSASAHQRRPRDWGTEEEYRAAHAFWERDPRHGGSSIQ